MKIGEAKMKTWGEMTDAEKGTLLLAHHEGKKIEFYDWFLKDWTNTVASPLWEESVAYRVKKVPVKRSTTLGMYFEYDNLPYASEWVANPTHKITFDTIDGVPDCSSIKMEKV